MKIVKSDHHLHHHHHHRHHLCHRHHHVGVFYVKIAVTANDKTNIGAIASPKDWRHICHAANRTAVTIVITHPGHHNSHDHCHHHQRKVSMKKHCHAMIMTKWQKLNLQL